MGVKATIIVTHYDNPVEPVVLDETAAANLHFGEMTPEHERRERRRRRNMRRDTPDKAVPTRFW